MLGGRTRITTVTHPIRCGSPTCLRWQWQHDRDASWQGSLPPAYGSACVHPARTRLSGKETAGRSTYKNRNGVRGNRTTSEKENVQVSLGHPLWLVMYRLNDRLIYTG